MKVAPVQLILDVNDRLMCSECGTLLFNTVAFIRGRTVYDTHGNTKYKVGVVVCGKCEVHTRATEREATHGE